MTHRERFAAIMNYQPFDRLPMYFFGAWPETEERWKREGGAGLQMPEMDPDWETSPDGKGILWDNQGMVSKDPIPPGQSRVVEETARHRIVRSALGGLSKYSKLGSCIPQHLEPDLQPAREDWERFKSYLNPNDPKRWMPGWEQRAESLNARDSVLCFFGGSLFGCVREWMGVQGISLLAYDDPALFADIIEHLADFYLEINSRLLSKARFDFAYFFEDCCFNSGPLISPRIYREFYDRHYRRLIRACRDLGVPFTLMDSDGKVDALVPCWLESGFDIIFPIEVGTWNASPVAFRKQYGRRMRMFGGVNKHVIPRGEAAIRAELEPLRPLVEEGGYIPIPDHRIPPDCSLDQFRTYVRVFKEVFAITN